MNNNIRIAINRFAQDLQNFDDISSFLHNASEKKEFLEKLFSLITQMKPQKEDIEQLKGINGVKSGATALKLLEKGINNNIFDKIIDLPDYEFKNTLKVSLELFKIAYQRQKKLHKINNRHDKWWFNDLNDSKYLDKIGYLTSMPVNFYEVKDNYTKVTILDISKPDVLLDKDDINTIIERFKIQFISFHVNYDPFILYKRVSDNEVSLVSIQFETTKYKKVYIGNYECITTDIVINNKNIGRITTVLTTFLNTESPDKIYSIITQYYNESSNYFTYKSYEDDTVSLLSLNKDFFLNSKKELILSI